MLTLFSECSDFMSEYSHIILVVIYLVTNLFIYLITCSVAQKHHHSEACETRQKKKNDKTTSHLHKRLLKYPI